MRVLQVEGLWAQCEARGAQRRVSLFQLQHEAVVAGDMLAVHADLALRRMSREEAESTWALLDEVLAADPAASAGGGARDIGHVRWR